MLMAGASSTMIAGSRWLWLTALVACGRVGFDPIDAPAGLRSSAVLWLQMEEADPRSGSIADAGTGHHAVLCSTTCPTSSMGKHGGGFHFAQQQLQVVWQSDLDVRNAYTIAVWAQLDQTPADGIFACAFTEPVSPALDGNSYSLCVNKQGPYTFTTDSRGTTGASDELSVGAAQPGVWVHLAATWERDPRTGLGTKAFYVDTLAASTSAEVPIDFDMSLPVVGADTGPLCLAPPCADTGPLYFWNGALDDVLLFDRVLTPAEIAELAAP
jgi:Concanavalin A-like lectin/glucanases superfamily